MIDDGSEDNSLDIMKRYSEKYSNFKCYTKENGGPAQARNFGIKHATGKYLMYLDPDDYLGKNTIESVCNFFDRTMMRLMLSHIILFQSRMERNKTYIFDMKC